MSNDTPDPSDAGWCGDSPWGVHQGSPCEHCGHESPTAAPDPTIVTETLSEWLLRQVDADEASAQDYLETFSPDEPFGPQISHDFQAHWDAGRVLAVGGAIRALADLHRPTGSLWVGGEFCAHDSHEYPCPTLRALVGIYADRDGAERITVER